MDALRCVGAKVRQYDALVYLTRRNLRFWAAS